MIKLEITATSVADLNTQLMHMLGIYPTCDECSNQDQEEEYSYGCHHEVEAPSHFNNWLFNTKYHDNEGFAISISKAYEEYQESYKQHSITEDMLGMDDFVALMLNNGFYIENTDCDSFFVLDETYGLEGADTHIHFENWLNNTQYFNPIKTTGAAYDNYWQSNYFANDGLEENILSLQGFVELMREKGFKTTTIDGVEYFTNAG